MSDSNPVVTPLEAGHILTKDMSPISQQEIDEMRNIPYQNAVGSIIYACQGTRPDLAHAVGMISRFNSNPGKEHWKAVKRIFRYLKGTINLGLEYSKKAEQDIIGFADANWASDLDLRRSTTGYAFILQGAAMSWNSKRQPTVALSTTEAKYMALASATQETVWLRGLAKEIGLNTNKPTTIYCDNRSAIDLSQNANYSARTKHIDTKHHFIKDKIKEGQIKLIHIPTAEMPADMLTKALTNVKLQKCNEKLGLRFVNKSISSEGVKIDDFD
ncbi:retrovirus-related pol polyprotein from transposon tnt 1-94 [Lasius niger]|uniref:Retrovirus-related pol polyprotein from transposon tnt 1-94 n=1 Tax=Lasius niger TaxID=67767 RepID=A0A0J7JWY4_LASNI|nr:retrovirus-related pol polyprotein from transposon tnt 1-94 [Lasius niger]